MHEKRWITCIIFLNFSYRHHHRFPPHYGGYLHCRITSLSAESLQTKRSRPEVKVEEHNEKKLKEKKNNAIVTLEDLFMKTTSKPCIYYKPLTDKEVIVLFGNEK